MKIRTAWFERPQDDGEVNLEPSLTVPGQAMSVEELFRRHAAGLPLGGERVAMYSEDPENDEIPDFARMDLAEIQEYRDMLNEKIMLGKKALHQARVEAENKKRQAEIQAAVEALEAKRKKADQRHPVQRTTGEGDDQGTE